MALIFPFLSPSTTYLTVLPYGSWEHSLECMNCRAHLSLWVGACLSQKEQFISQARWLQPAGLVCTAWATSAVKTAGLLRFPCGPAFSRSKGEHQRWGWTEIAKVTGSSRNSYMNLSVSLTSLSLSKRECRQRGAESPTPLGLGSACGQCSGGFCRFIWGSRLTYENTWVLKIIIFAVFDHVILKRFLKLRFRL